MSSTPIAPINFVACYSLVPIFQWEMVEPPGNASTPPAPVVTDVTDATEQQTPDPSPRELRLVFKGFGWRPGAEIATYPRPEWMAGYASGSADAADPSSQDDDRDRRVDAASRGHKAAQHAPPQGTHDSESVSSQRDRTDSD